MAQNLKFAWFSIRGTAVNRQRLFNIETIKVFITPSDDEKEPYLEAEKSHGKGY